MQLTKTMHNNDIHTEIVLSGSSSSSHYIVHVEPCLHPVSPTTAPQHNALKRETCPKVF